MDYQQTMWHCIPENRINRKLKESAFNRTRQPVISQQQHESPWRNSLDNDDNCEHEYDIKDESGQTK
jgi:hypothetical protein